MLVKILPHYVEDTYNPLYLYFKKHSEFFICLLFIKQIPLASMILSSHLLSSIFTVYPHTSAFPFFLCLCNSFFQHYSLGYIDFSHSISVGQLFTIKMVHFEILLGHYWLSLN